MTQIIAFGLAYKHPPYMNKERTAHLKKYHFVSTEQLAQDIGLSVRYTFKYLRRLGLRSCSNNRNPVS